MTVLEIIQRYQRGESLVAITAYDFICASLCDRAGVDIILVGDSVGTTLQGHPTTIPVTLDQMVYHTSMVARGTHKALVVADLPFMSYQVTPEDGVRAAGALIKDGGAQAVKLEGFPEVAEKIVRAGIPVMGHVGLLPQAFHQSSGYRVQGKDTASRKQILEMALELQSAGAFAVVLELIPSDLAQEITEQLSIPTIGIGAGGSCSGQILVLHDLIGLHPPDAKVPSFVKQFAQVGREIERAVKEYGEEVRRGDFPGAPKKARR